MRQACSLAQNRQGSGHGPDPRATGFVPNPKAKLRDQVHEAIRFFHYSRRTEEAYWGWIRRFLVFCRDHPHLTPALSPPSEGAEREQGWRHPREMGAPEVAEFLSHLAQERDVAAATQNQALNALVFLYGVVLRQRLGDLGDWARVTRPARLPAVLGREEMSRVLAVVTPEYQLPVRLMYGSGLRLLDLVRLRVKDVNLERRQILVRDGKPRKRLRLTRSLCRNVRKPKQACFTFTFFTRIQIKGCTSGSQPSCGEDWPSTDKAGPSPHLIGDRGG